MNPEHLVGYLPMRELVNLDEALAFARRTLQELGAPPGSELAYTLDGETVTQPIDAPLGV